MVNISTTSRRKIKKIHKNECTCLTEAAAAVNLSTRADQAPRSCLLVPHGTTNGPREDVSSEVVGEMVSLFFHRVPSRKNTQAHRVFTSIWWGWLHMVEIVKGEYKDIAHKAEVSCLADSPCVADAWGHGGTILHKRMACLKNEAVNQCPPVCSSLRRSCHVWAVSKEVEDFAGSRLMRHSGTAMCRDSCLWVLCQHLCGPCDSFRCYGGVSG